jgi:hypothetical protein
MSILDFARKQRSWWAIRFAFTASLIAVACMALGGRAEGQVKSVPKPSWAADPSNESLFQAAILAKPNSKESTKAIWLLFKRGKEVKAPQAIWLQGPPTPQGKWENEDFFALRECRLSKLNEVQYVFYGSREAKDYLYLLHVRTYPDDKPRFVILAAALITPELENDPGIKFEHPSVWDMPEPQPAQ